MIQTARLRRDARIVAMSAALSVLAILAVERPALRPRAREVLRLAAAAGLGMAGVAASAWPLRRRAGDHLVKPVEPGALRGLLATGGQNEHGPEDRAGSP
jgi:hypothetical protein